MKHKLVIRYKKLFSYIAIVFPLSLSAQTMSIQGRILDTEKNELPAATVRCYVHDTVYVKGTTTNGKGEFELKVPQNEQTYKLLFTYFGYKNLNLKLNPTKEKNIRLGEVIMNRDVMQMQEVTVLGENIVQTAEKTMVYPTKEQLRHAYDGYSALEVLMVPGIRVDHIDQEPTYMNESILLCINGREATKEEVQDLNAKDIKRVDFYSNGQIDYPEAASVLDFVMKERDYAGTVGLNGTHRLNLPEGNVRGTAQYFQNGSEYAFSLSDSYQDATLHSRGVSENAYHYPEQTVINTEKDLPSQTNLNNFNAYFNYIVKNNQQDFYSSFRIKRSVSTSDSRTLQTYNTSGTQNTREEYNRSQRISPSVKLRYIHTLPHNQKLRAELYGSYGNNHKDRWYEQRADNELLSDYTQRTDENSWYVQAKFNYTKTFNKQSSLSAELAPDYTHTRDRLLREGTPSAISLDNSNTRLYATYVYKIKNKLNLQARVAGHLSYNHTAGSTELNTYFIPSFKVSYFHKNHSLKTQLTVWSEEPGLSNRTGDEYQRNEFSIMKGNPDLKESVKYNLTADYSYTRGRLSVLAHAGVNISTNHVYNDILYDDSRHVFVFQQINGDKSISQQYSLDIQYQLLPKLLTLGVEGLYGHYKMNLWEDIVVNQYRGNVYMMLLHKGWKLSVSYTTPNNALEEVSGTFTHKPASVNVSAGYSIDNWNFSFYARNPFYHARFTGHSTRQDYSLQAVHCIPKMMDNYFSINVSYRFNFGKKKHKFDNTQVEDVNRSTIL